MNIAWGGDVSAPTRPSLKSVPASKGMSTALSVAGSGGEARASWARELLVAVMLAP